MALILYASPSLSPFPHDLRQTQQPSMSPSAVNVFETESPNSNHLPSKGASENVHSLLHVAGTHIVNHDGKQILLKGTALGGHLNMENFITGTPHGTPNALLVYTTSPQVTQAANSRFARPWHKSWGRPRPSSSSTRYVTVNVASV